jgi:hypothetical protein
MTPDGYSRWGGACSAASRTAQTIGYDGVEVAAVFDVAEVAERLDGRGAKPVEGLVSARSYGRGRNLGADLLGTNRKCGASVCLVQYLSLPSCGTAALRPPGRIGDTQGRRTHVREIQWRRERARPPDAT